MSTPNEKIPIADQDLDNLPAVEVSLQVEIQSQNQDTNSSA